MLNIDIGVFAHNEESNIKLIIEAIQKQNIIYMEDYSVKVYILANGCSDETVNIAKKLTDEIDHFEIVDLPIGGKSRTWNRFVHEFSRNDVDQLIFCDSDIWFTKNTILKNISDELKKNPLLSAVSSRPVKDLSMVADKLSFIDKVIAASGDGLNNWKTSICGQLYVLTSSTARSIYLPIGLPVEDGYIRAMILTDCMTKSENFSKISGNKNIFHIYKSEKTIPDLINHQTRIVIGSAINFLIFNALRNNKLNQIDMLNYTKSISEDESWLPKLIKSELPSKKYGWVPWHFLTKRVKYAISDSSRLFKPKKIIVLILGFGFDLIVFLRAQYKMVRGNGVGYW